MTDSEYILSLIDEAFAEVPQIKAHHNRMRAIAGKLSVPFVMDARATMAMHFMASMIGYPDKEDTKRGACGVPIFAGYAVEYADALIAELAKGKTE